MTSGNRTARPKRAGGIEAALWRCPDCGHRFVTRNLSHSCADVSLDSHFSGRPVILRQLYRRWLAFVRRHGGPVLVSTNRTRIAFMTEVRFASCSVMSDRLRCSIALSRPVRDARFVQIKQEVPGWWAHRFDLAKPADARLLDRRLAALVAESWRDFGRRGRLKGAKA